jgi:hypothetical protein
LGDTEADWFWDAANWWIKSQVNFSWF